LSADLVLNVDHVQGARWMEYQWLRRWPWFFAALGLVRPAGRDIALRIERA